MNSQLFVCVVLAISQVRCEKAKEEPFKVPDFIQDLNAKVQNATNTLENIFGIDIPSTQEEVKNVVRKNLDDLKSNAEKIQKKLAEYNMTGSSLQGMLDKAQQELNKTVEGFANSDPNVRGLVNTLQAGYDNLAKVTKTVGDVVKEQATSASGDLKNFAEQAQVELSKAATKLESQVQEVLQQDKTKKSKTA